MKKIRLVILILSLIVAAAVVTLCCAGCDFVQYIKIEENNKAAAHISELRQEYVLKLYESTSSVKYRDKERKLYEYAVQDAENELNECMTEEELIKVYDKHLNVIGGIKTEAEYLEEESASELSVYRSAILKRAGDSYDKNKYSAEQTGYLDACLQNLSAKITESSDKEEMNRFLNDFYFDVHKEDEIAELITFVDLSTYEEAQKELLTRILGECTQNIRKCAVKEEIDEFKSVYKFQVYKQDTLKKIKGHIEFELYRAEQVIQLESLLEEYIEIVSTAVTTAEADNAFREFQIAVYAVPTDAMFYEEELTELKADLYTALTDEYKLSLYREEESTIVGGLLQEFKETSERAVKKEDVLSAYLTVKSRIDSVKTDKVLKEEERLILIEELYENIKQEINSRIEEADREEYLIKAEAVYLAMFDRISSEGIRDEYQSFIDEILSIFGDQISLVRDELKNFNSSVYYRENEQRQVDAVKEEYLAKLADVLDIQIAKTLLDEAKAEIAKIKTNDDLWSDSLAAFRAELKELYGQSVLEEPESLTEAKNYYELAEIIDYFAFYQLSDTEFVCDTFRVKLNYDHNNAMWERNEVYWYCELIRSAAGFTAVMENNDYLVITLVPYAMATKTNRNDVARLNRYENKVEFDSDKSAMTSRSDTFDGFKYYNYGREVSVWNSQQLWYALEHEYVPVCEEGSPAEVVLERAKLILRGIISEGMSDKEKIFSIYSWFGENVQFDSLYSRYFTSSDYEMFPDEKAATSRAYHADGALLEGLAVCEGYAKSYLILLRLEGIESYRIFIRDNNLRGINSINAQKSVNYAGYGSHAFCVIGMDGKYYYSDTEKSFVSGKESLQSIQQLLAPPDLSAGSFRGFTFMYPDFVYADDVSDIYGMLKYSGSICVSDVNALRSVLSDFNAIEKEHVQMTIIFKCANADYDGMSGYVTDALSAFDYVEKSVSNAEYVFKEFVVYK